MTPLVVLMALLSSMFAPSVALAADPDTTIDATWTAVSPSSQEAGKEFRYSLAMSCSATVGQSCDLDKLVIPLPVQPFPAAAGSTSIADWNWLAQADPTLISPSIPVIANGNVTWNFNRNLLPGESVVVIVKATPPNVTTPDNTTWDAAPTITWATGSTTLPAVTYTATASTDVVADKYVSDGASIIPGGKSTYELSGSIAKGAGDTFGTGDLGAASQKMVDRLPAEAVYVSSTNGGVYDAAAHTVTWENSCAVACPAISGSVTVSWPLGTATGDYLNTMTFSGVPLGATEPVSASDDALVSVTANVGNLHRKTALGNFSSDGRWVQPDTINSAESSYSLFMGASSSVGVDWRIVDPLPCSTNTSFSTIYNSGDRTSLCQTPVVDVKHLNVDMTGTDTSVPLNITVFYADGTTADFTPAASGDLDVHKAGTVVSRIEGSGSNLQGSTGTTITIYGSVPGSVVNWESEDIVRNTLYGSYRATGSANWGSWTGMQADLTVKLGTVFAANFTLNGARTFVIDPTTPGQGSASEGRWYGGAVAGAGAEQVVTVIGAGLPAGTTKNLETAPEADGTRIIRGSQGLWFSRATPGVWTVDSYVGFEGLKQFENDVTPIDYCARFQGTTITEMPGQYVLDTTGLMGGTAEIPVPMCKVSYQVVVSHATPAFLLQKFVQGDGDAARVASPGSTNVRADGTGTATYSWDFTNVGNEDFSSSVLYDVFPRVDDTGIILSGESRGSTYRPTLAAVPAAVEGWTWAYSTALNPCRPEVLANNPSCVDDWSTTAPADLSTVTAVRMVSAAGLPKGASSTFAVTMNVPAFDESQGVAWNTVAGSAVVPSGANPLPAEAPKVGIGSIAPKVTVPTWDPALGTADQCGTEASVFIVYSMGVQYTESRVGNVVTVTATAKDGFVLAPGATTSWTFTIPEIEPCDVPVTPVAPELIPAAVCGIEATVSTPEVEGVVYRQTRTGSTITVTATATKGFVLADGATSSWEFTLSEVVPCVDTVTPATPVLVPASECGIEATVLVPETNGVSYTQTRSGNTVSITAAANSGFVLTDGAVTSWTIEIPAIEPCDIRVTPAAPSVKAAEACGTEDAVVVPDTEGVVYTQTRDGQQVTVKATVKDGFVLADGAIASWVFDLKKAEDCVVTPTPTPTPTPTSTQTVTPVPTPTSTPTYTPTPSVTDTPEVTPTPQPTETFVVSVADQDPTEDLAQTGASGLVTGLALGALALVGGAVLLLLTRRRRGGAHVE
ncbi:hypothetical protein ANMWB30_23400 [Arthrobacter sp. MWB30]|nr:hypothetical protein ANMWB30_23400 [Arthrobacter sp. MWB30]